MSVADELTKLVALRDSGVITPEEFDQQRAMLLGTPPAPAAIPEPVPSPTVQWGPASQTGAGMACGRCHKPLSPAWRGKCNHCGAAYADFPPVAPVSAPVPGGVAVAEPSAPRSRKRLLVIGGTALVALLAVGALAGDPSSTGGTPSSTPRPTTQAAGNPTSTPDATVVATATVSPTSAPTEEPPTAEPPTDPELAYTVWTSTFGQDATLGFFRDDVAAAIEADFYWIDSIDRTRYDPERNLLIYDASIDYESVYRSDPAEWRSDSWELYRDFSRDVWGTFIEGIGEPGGVVPDWSRWTPRVRLNGNGGRLTVDCPGTLIYAITLREATQDEFAKECSFKT